jgi:putative peptidoglycan lipid II flippase
VIIVWILTSKRFYEDCIKEITMVKTRLAKAAGVIMVMTLINKAVGFLRDALVASAFGTTYLTDAYNMAMTISDFLFIMIALAITTTFIPVLSDVLRKKGKEEMFELANNIINILTVISIVIVILSVIFAPQIVKIIAPKFTGETYLLSVELTKISVISLVFLVLHSAYTAVLQTLDDFLGPTIVGVLLNLPIIIYILMGAKGGVTGLTIATLVGMVLRTLTQIPFLIKHGFRFKPILNIKDSRIRRLIVLILPVIVGASANQINKIVNKTISSGLPEGSIAALSFAERLSDVFYTTFAVAIVTVMFPTLARTISENNKERFKGYLVSTINTINLTMIPCAVGVAVLSVPMVTILFKHGVFDDKSVQMTSMVLFLYGIGLPFYSLRDVFNRALYAMEDTKTSTKNSVIAVVINIILNIVTVKRFGLGGIAASSTIAAGVCAFLLFRSLSKKIDGIETKAVVLKGIKIIGASAIMGVVISITYRYVFSFLGGMLGMIIALGIAATVGILIYGIMLGLLKVEEYTLVLNKLKVKLKL